MEQTAQIKECAHTVAGIVAHVDAGKTTLAESMLYFKDEGYNRISRRL